MTLTGRTGTAVVAALIVSLCINLLLAGMMLGGRWHDGPRRHGMFFGGPIMGKVPEEARPLVREVFDAHKAEFDAHREAIRQTRLKVAELLKADVIDQAQLDQALNELLQQSQMMQQFGHDVMIEIAQKLPPEVRREMAEDWAKERFGKKPPPEP
jgi:Spy/CpxP family protein refolding chaperone